MARNKHIDDIRKIQTQINGLVKHLCKEKPLLKGTYTYVMKKCANPNCTCHKKPKHPIHRITWIDNGKGKSLSLQNLDLKEALKFNKNYQEYRKMRFKLIALQETLSRMLAKQEKALIDNEGIVKKLKAQGQHEKKAAK